MPPICQSFTNWRKEESYTANCILSQLYKLSVWRQIPLKGPSLLLTVFVMFNLRVTFKFKWWVPKNESKALMMASEEKKTLKEDVHALIEFYKLFPVVWSPNRWMGVYVHCRHAVSAQTMKAGSLSRLVVAAATVSTRCCCVVPDIRGRKAMIICFGMKSMWHQSLSWWQWYRVLKCFTATLKIWYSGYLHEFWLMASTISAVTLS